MKNNKNTTIEANPELADRLLNLQIRMSRWLGDLGLQSVGPSEFEKEVKLTASEMNEFYSIQTSLMLHLDLARIALDPSYVGELRELVDSLNLD